MEDVLHAVARTVISFILLMFITFLIGKQVNPHKNYFSFALSIILGSFVANMGFDVNLKFLPMLTSFLALFLIYYLISFISFKSRVLRKWFSGQPTVIINRGHILESNMKKLRYSIDDLNQQLRELGIFDIKEVEYALLEVSGNLSVLKKQQYQNTVKSDILKTESKQLSLPIELIIEGKLIDKNLTLKYNKNWIEQELIKRKLSINRILYAVIGTDGKLYVELYKDNAPSLTDKY
ncbi:DUF421 domain-containing protein [Bacillus methanolicus]|uniref:YetF C-terminal domain-containing protein n=1 Tax=Bacillus methanolicus (strain MGA3 / ATCC 53907) TaxID=796606 RepID=I3DZM9_BACMM|nr:DUF421 domain-containing protein [Bacillus methanolicus]AIE59764.1 hypothetical protein BMMGA3_06690 [Bacillus methanolicus MGA3]EIJ79700.1 hypothetical protein MGA3_15141 [Bacillus methanolicus MGA3]